MSTTPEYLAVEHRLVHFSSVIPASIPDSLKVLNDVLEEKQPRYKKSPMLAGLWIGTILSVARGAVDEAFVSVIGVVLDLDGESPALLDCTAEAPLEAALLMGVGAVVVVTAETPAVLYTLMWLIFQYLVLGSAMGSSVSSTSANGAHSQVFELARVVSDELFAGGCSIFARRVLGP